MKKPMMLMILDGFGLSDTTHGNAIAAARKPNLDRIFAAYPFTKLSASGLAVGLPEGQMGNSEVGHLNIGAGRIVYQELTRISKSIEDGDFYENPAFLDACAHVKRTGGRLHLMGLLSDGGVHSHFSHLSALIRLAAAQRVPEVYVHCFTDGRDVPPTSGAGYMEELEALLEEEKACRIGVVSGRYYAMDRDKRWERLQLAYDALTLGRGLEAESGAAAVAAAYARGETDEFIRPTIVRRPEAAASGHTAAGASGIDGASDGFVRDGDAIIFFNFRPDRARELTRAFTDPDFDGFYREKTVQNLHFVCMTQYDASMPGVQVAFPPHRPENTLGAYVSGLGLQQLRIAETEKYAHVTFFFNGGVEEPSPGEARILVPSPKVATYDLQPEMSAEKVTDAVLAELDRDLYDLIILNFANADMVGHTGVFSAAVKAIETLDAMVGRIEQAILRLDGQILLTADHGNAEEMLSPAGEVLTAHTTNPVPLVHIANRPVRGLASGGRLCDIAPTMLALMGLPQPEEMTGHSLIR